MFPLSNLLLSSAVLKHIDIQLLFSSTYLSISQILEWDKRPLSSVPFDRVAPLIEQSNLDRVVVVVRSG